MWALTMIRLPSPIVVASSGVKPRWMVTFSRIMLPLADDAARRPVAGSQMLRATAEHGALADFIVASQARIRFHDDPGRQAAAVADLDSSSMTQNGPTETSRPSCAWPLTMAVG